MLPVSEERISKDNIVHYIRTKLGGTRHSVELDDQQIDLAIDDAVRLFRRYIFGRRTIAKPEIVGIQRFELPDNAFAVTRFDVLTTDRPSFAEAELNVFELNRNRLYGLYGDRPGALQELIIHIEQSRRTRGTEPEYWLIQDETTDPVTNDIVIYVPSGPRDVSYDVAISIRSPEDVPFVHEKLFLETVEAYSREMLGDMRGKYGGTLPGPTGDLQLDAEKQSTKATEMMIGIKEELRKLGLAMPPVTG
jgi:hypothetical protein